MSVKGENGDRFTVLTSRGMLDEQEQEQSQMLAVRLPC